MIITSDVSHNSYEVRFQKYTNDDNEVEIVKIFIGPKKRHCVVISIYMDDSDPDYVFAELEGVSHNSMCSVRGSLPRGGGTLDMLNSALAFIFIEYPFLKGIKLKDTSRISCNGKSLKLHSLKLATHGNTWYGIHLGAHCETSKGEVEMTGLKTKLDATFSKLNFKEFYNRYVRRNCDEMLLQKENIELLRGVFEKATSFSGFVEDVLRTTGLKCEALLIWLDAFVYHHTNYLNDPEMHWIIDRDDTDHSQHSRHSHHTHHTHHTHHSRHSITIDRTQCGGGNDQKVIKQVLRSIRKNLYRSNQML